MKDRKFSAEIVKLISFVCELLRKKNSEMVFLLMNSFFFALRGRTIQLLLFFRNKT